MEVRKLGDPAAFLEAAGPVLLSDEARHNLMLGIAGGLRDQPGLYHELRSWIVEGDGAVVAVALQTPPFNLVLARPATDRALDMLVAELVADDVELPGVTGAVPEADVFGRLWTAATGLTLRARMRQRIYKLTTVRPIRGAPGRARVATPDDRPLLLEWGEAFAVESFEDYADPGAATRMVESRLDSGLGGFAVWEDEGRPVSLVGWGGATPNGVRIGPVYTPPSLRRRGYASALTAWVSAQRLASGRTFCFLYTDLENPTSNRIYMDVGYEPVCDSCDYAFEAPRSAH
jgi:predicted GNAT family acetyltransferase